MNVEIMFLSAVFFGKLNPFKKKQASIKPVTGVLLHGVLQCLTASYFQLRVLWNLMLPKDHLPVVILLSLHQACNYILLAI